MSRVFFRERMLDIVAGDLGIDPAELRRKNLIPPTAMPYRVGVTRPGNHAMVYDSGDYPAVLDRALEKSGYSDLRQEQGVGEDGRLHGVGVACFVKSTGSGMPYEGARVVVTGAREVAVYLGIATLGQGHETIMAQICADGLGVPSGVCQRLPRHDGLHALWRWDSCQPLHGHGGERDLRGGPATAGTDIGHCGGLSGCASR